MYTKGHDWGTPMVTTKPTCTADGVSTTACKVCSQMQTAVVKKLGHKYGDWEVVKPANCEEDGLQKQVCANCGDKVEEIVKRTNPLGHEWWQYRTVLPTCKTGGYVIFECRKCLAVEYRYRTDPEHPKDGYSEKKDPAATCQEAGLLKWECKACGQKGEKVLDKLEHILITDKDQKGPNYTFATAYDFLTNFNDITTQWFYEAKTGPTYPTCSDPVHVKVYCWYHNHGGIYCPYFIRIDSTTAGTTAKGHVWPKFPANWTLMADGNYTVFCEAGCGKVATANSSGEIISVK